MSAEEFKAKGNAALQAKKFDEAIEMYTEAIKLDPSNQVFYSNRSAAYLSNGNTEAALADGEAAINAKSDWPKGYSRKGAALHAMKKYDEAEAVYNAGLVAVPGDATLSAALKEVKDAAAKEAAKASAPPNPFGNLMAKIATHPKFSEWMSDPAMAQKIGMLQTNPNAALGQFMSDPTMHPVLEAALGFKFGNAADFAGGADGGGAGPMDQGEEDSDDDDSEGAVGASKEPKSKPAAAPAAKAAPPPAPKELTEEEKAAAAIAEIRAKGNEHYKKKEWAEALECYDKVIEQDPSQVAVLNNKAAVYMEMGDLDAAEKQCEEAVEKARALRPTPFEGISKIFVRWGKVHVKRKDLKTALEYYQKAKLEYLDKDLERLIKTTELDKKKRDAKEYINPELAEAAKERGNDAFRAQDWKTAINEYEDAIKRDPKNPAYHNNLAATLSKIMDFQGAKREVEKALELDPKYVKAWSRKGDIEFLQKEYHKAMESYQKGLSFDDASKACRDGLAKTMQQVNGSSQGMSEDERKERAAHGMADPEIQAILQDPVVRQVIQDLSTQEPKAQAAGQKALRDPVMGAKINKLIAAGVLQTG